MSTWHFFQGIRDEWLWYRMDETGSVAATADRGFEELTACMANAEAAGFERQNYQVHTRPSVTRPLPQPRPEQPAA